MVAEGELKFPEPNELSNNPEIVDVWFEISLMMKRYEPSKSPDDALNDNALEVLGIVPVPDE
jgi:hypothetical protein